MRNCLLAENVRLHLIETNKFKDVSISIRFMSDLSERKAAIRTLLSFMLPDSCEKYASKQAITSALDNLYGANITCKTNTYGQGQTLEMKIRCLNERFVLTSILEKQFALLHEFLFSPLMEKGYLSSSIFEESKINLKSMIQRFNDNPSMYAMIRSSEIAGAGYPLGLSSLGTEEIVDSLSIEEVSKEYQDLLKNDIVDIFVVGNVDWESIECYVKRFLPFTARSRVVPTYYQLPKQSFTQSVEKKKIDQTMVSILANINCDIHSDNYWTTRVANAIFGQLPSSLLFQEVREKNSLCYSISSSLLSYDGMISINTGIEKKEVNRVIDLIKEQLQRVQKGDFSDDLLQTSKEMMINAILSAHDDASSLINFGYQNALLNRNQSIDETIERINAATKSEVIQAFAEVKICTVFVLEQE